MADTLADDRTPDERESGIFVSSSLRDVTEIERRIEYVFQDRQLLAEALTHSSLPNEKPGLTDNRRLAYLGDAVLELVVRQTFLPDRPAALDLASADKLKQDRVSDASRALCAQRLDLGRSLFAGGARSSADTNETVLSEALEALVGGVYLDGGLGKAREVLHRVLLAGDYPAEG